MGKRDIEEIDRIMDYLLEKNKELYRRLATDDYIWWTKAEIKERRKVAERGKLQKEIHNFKGELKCRIV